MERRERDAPLPVEMQGRWRDIEDPASELFIKGGEIVCFARVIDYDYMVVATDDGALTVSLKLNDAAAEEAFQRANVTELVMTPDGELHAYNVRFASQFQRMKS
ncbi:hypothetical protein [Novosphingobium decolorationis]|uniref:Uncharacterized protein n=1 Tax=Novosphingobium decolorationis TaxID=2698673 RepID=A0ABX8E2R2_9SPHN|nr:hypothetical protein [Novosphingobium decolorationis]QVM83358.1 hypothetical protein HT578_06330 [Novosphingobium decolorationis]